MPEETSRPSQVGWARTVSDLRERRGQHEQRGRLCAWCYGLPPAGGFICDDCWLTYLWVNFEEEDEAHERALLRPGFVYDGGYGGVLQPLPLWRRQEVDQADDRRRAYEAYRPVGLDTRQENECIEQESGRADQRAPLSQGTGGRAASPARRNEQVYVRLVQGRIGQGHSPHAAQIR